MGRFWFICQAVRGDELWSKEKQQGGNCHPLLHLSSNLSQEKLLEPPWP